MLYGSIKVAHKVPPYLEFIAFHVIQGVRMKSRELKTIYDLIASNYQITEIDDGKFLHSFTPMTTDTKYQFIANV